MYFFLVAFSVRVDEAWKQRVVPLKIYMPIMLRFSCVSFMYKFLVLFLQVLHHKSKISVEISELSVGLAMTDFYQYFLDRSTIFEYCLFIEQN